MQSRGGDAQVPLVCLILGMEENSLRIVLKACSLIASIFRLKTEVIPRVTPGRRHTFVGFDREMAPVASAIPSRVTTLIE
jgi:hypothetical protein